MDVNKHAARPFGEAGAVSSPPLCFSFDLQKPRHRAALSRLCHGTRDNAVTILRAVSRNPLQRVTARETRNPSVVTRCHEFRDNAWRIVTAWSRIPRQRLERCHSVVTDSVTTLGALSQRCHGVVRRCDGIRCFLAKGRPCLTHVSCAATVPAQPAQPAQVPRCPFIGHVPKHFLSGLF